MKQLFRSYRKLLAGSIIIFLFFIIGFIPLYNHTPWLQKLSEAGASIYGAIIGIVMAIIAALFVVKQMGDEREETRRIKTIEIMQWYSDKIEQHPRWNDSRSIIDRLNKSECQLLDMKEKLWVSNDLKVDIQQLMAVNKIDDQNWNRADAKGEYLLPYEYALELRKDAIDYLNVLETIASSWQNYIVCKEDIEKQMGFLYSRDDGAVLHNFRKAIGEENYPNLKSLLEELKRLDSISSPKKAKQN